MRYGGEKLEQNKGRGHRILTPNDSVLTFRSPNYLYSNGAFGVSCNGFYVESTQIGELSRLNVWVEFIQSELKHFCIRIVIRLQQGRFYVGQGALAPPPPPPPPSPPRLLVPLPLDQKLADRSDVISEVPECSKIQIFQGSAPDPAAGAYSAPRPSNWWEGYSLPPVPD